MSAAADSRRAHKLARLFDAADGAPAYASAYIERMADVIRAIDANAVAQAADVIGRCAQDNQTFFVMGNGGSGAVAAHWVNDLGANTVVSGKPGFRAISLSDNASAITAIANDASYEQIFSLQLAAAMRTGDVVMALSVSGNSPNVLRAVDYANDNGAYTIGCSGMSGGELMRRARLSVHVPSTADEYGPIEDMFSVVMHIIQTYISMRRGRYLAH
jgi:D-sedoheptulose 7-phosphate isomerase